MKPSRLRPLPPDPSFTWAPNRPCLINHPSQMRKLLGVIASSDAITGSDLVTIRPAVQRSAFQPRRLMIAPAAAGCKRCYAAAIERSRSFGREKLSRHLWIGW
jgi:hypothetical protein